MESIEEQWFLPPTSDITSKSWANITDAKKAVKTWILDHGESWAPSTHNKKTRLNLRCLSMTCSFSIRIAQQKCRDLDIVQPSGSPDSLQRLGSHARDAL
jgi:hypothetical protein